MRENRESENAAEKCEQAFLHYRGFIPRKLLQDISVEREASDPSVFVLTKCYLVLCSLSPKQQRTSRDVICRPDIRIQKNDSSFVRSKHLPFVQQGAKLLERPVRVAIQAITSRKTVRWLGRLNRNSCLKFFSVRRVVAIHELAEKIVNQSLVSSIASDENAHSLCGQKINRADCAHPVAILPDDASSVRVLFPIGERGAGDARIVCVLPLEHALRRILVQNSLRFVLS